MATIPTPDQLQEAFDTATAERTPHYNWLPPEWKDKKPDLKPDNNITDEPIFNQPTPLACVVRLDDRIGILKGKFKKQLDHVTSDRPVEPEADDEKDPKLSKMPHPGSDFGHVDPGIYDVTKQGDFQKAIKALRSLEGSATKDGEMDKSFRQALPSLVRAEDMIGANPKGLQRLKLAFEYTLCHVTTLFGEINVALMNIDPNLGKTEYNEARRKYIEFLRDLDNHEPRKEEMVPGERGYGRTLKWIYVRPIIHDGKIKGAKVVAKWNPHISSSGIPIPHP